MGTRRYFRNPGMWGLQYLQQTSIGTCANIYNHDSGYESDDIDDVGRDLELRELMKPAVMPDRHYNCLGIWVMHDATQLVPRNWNPVVMQGASIMIFEPGIINPAAVLEYECHMVIWNP
jgi:hypothetical protein